MECLQAAGAHRGLGRLPLPKSRISVCGDFLFSTANGRAKPNTLGQRNPYRKVELLAIVGVILGAICLIFCIRLIMKIYKSLYHLDDTDVPDDMQ